MARPGTSDTEATPAGGTGLAPARSRPGAEGPGPRLLGGSPVDLRRRHLRPLDGLRAVAVSAVVLYHLGLGWAGGGYLGVDVFFVLSGFLITGLLLEERSTSGTIELAAFWMRRARRLLPALALVLGAVALYAAAGGPGTNLQTLQRDLPATILYFANWHFIAIHSTYFAQFVTPSPLEHTWSLAIEEQFYLGWPLVLLVVARIRRWNWRLVSVAVVALLAAGSAVDMAYLARGANDVSRAYFGTDSRVFELMVGALLALWAESAHRSWQAFSRWRRLHGATAVAALGLLVGFDRLGGPPHWMFEGGFLGVAVLSAVIIAGTTQDEEGPVGRILSTRLLGWLGTISYGLYLWHWPVVVFLTRSSTGLPGWLLDACRVALTLVLATASFYLVEQPVRRGSPRARRVALIPVGAAVVPIVAALALVAPTFDGAAVEPPASSSSLGPVFALSAVPTPARPLRVVLIGDSVMQSAAPALIAAFASTSVVVSKSYAFGGWGLTTDSSWRRHLTNEIARFHPDVVVGTWIWDGPVALAHPALYQILLDEAVQVALTPGDGVRGVVLLQFPRVGSTSPLAALGARPVNVDAKAWNDVAAAEAAARPRSVAFLRVAGSLESGGRYSTWLPDARGRWVRARTTDETHLCPPGAARYASAALAALSGPWHLAAPARPWWQEAWIRLPLYYRDAICPNDGPPAG